MSEADKAGPERQSGESSLAEELRYRLSQQELIAEFGRFALKARDLTDLLQEATVLCARGLQTKYCKIMEYLPQEAKLFVRAGVGWRPGVVGNARVSADSGSPTGYAYHSGEAVISNHLAIESRFRTPRLLEEHGIKRAINVVINGDDNRFGILEVDSSAEGRFTEADSLFLQAFSYLIGLAIDRHKAEAKVKEQLEFQVLMNAEIGHRVKNSLAMVAAMLALQRRASSDVSIQSALADAEARIQTIADVHDRLWRTSELSTVDLETFVTDLCTRLAAAAGHHTVRCCIAHIDVSTDMAVTLGLLINELVTNAFKYAYPDERGVVTISVTTEDDKRLRLEVSDRGIGLKSAPGKTAVRSLGMKLIATLSRQLEAQVQWEEGNPGTRFIMVFAK
jgi:two-component sensor histidine kinase